MPVSLRDCPALVGRGRHGRPSTAASTSPDRQVEERLGHGDHASVSRSAQARVGHFRRELVRLGGGARGLLGSDRAAAEASEKGKARKTARMDRVPERISSADLLRANTLAADERQMNQRSASQTRATAAGDDPVPGEGREADSA